MRITVHSFLSGSWTNYWAGNNNRTEYNVGYSKSVSWGNFSVNLQRSWNEDGNKDDAMYLNVSVPLENIFGGKRKSSGFRNLSTQFNTDFNGSHQLNVSSSGNSEDNLIGYSVNTGYNLDKESENVASVGGYLSYDSTWGGFSASASASTDNRQQYSGRCEQVPDMRSSFVIWSASNRVHHESSTYLRRQ